MPLPCHILKGDMPMQELRPTDLPPTADCIRSIQSWLSGYPAQPLAYVHSFGCQLNVAEGEQLSALLTEMGYGMTDDVTQASLILYHTCAVRENAEDRVFGTLGSIKHLKAENPDLILCVTGCMSAQASVAEKLAASYPYVDIVLGTTPVCRLPQLLYAHMQRRQTAPPAGAKRKTLRPLCDLHTDTDIPEGQQSLRDSTFRASVPIMYGCNNFCTYCIVPYVRGRERSRHPAQICEEVQALVKAGYREILLLGQNVNSYGHDLPEDTDFPSLLRELDRIPGDYWIRFMSSHPKDATPALFDAILDCEHVAKHLHLPVQSGSDAILDRMNRRYTVAQYLEKVAYLRERVPDFSLTTDLIVGFPGETEEDFAATLSLVEQVRFDNMYSFIYSRRTGTKAADMPDPVTPQEKSRRMQRLLSLQREIAVENNKRFVGRVMRVLCDGESRKSPGMLTGRSTENMLVEFPGTPDQIGSFVTVTITASHSGMLDGIQETA